MAGAVGAAEAVRGGSGAADDGGGAGMRGAINGVAAGAAARASGGATGCDGLVDGGAPATEVPAGTAPGSMSDRGVASGGAEGFCGVGRAGCGRNTAGGSAAAVRTGFGADEGASSRMTPDRPTKPSVSATLP
jgi:hypothetical protein